MAEKESHPHSEIILKEQLSRPLLERVHVRSSLDTSRAPYEFRFRTEVGGHGSQSLVVGVFDPQKVLELEEIFDRLLQPGKRLFFTLTVEDQESDSSDSQ